MNKFYLYYRAILAGILFLFIFSCAGIYGKKPDIVSETKVNGTISNADVRRIVVDQPFLISGDYFRERPTPKDTIDLSKFFSESKSIEQRVAKLEKKLEGKNAPMSKPMAMSGQPIKAQVQRVSGEPLEKIGIIMFHKNNYFRDELSSDLNLSSPSYGFLFFSDAQLRELLSPTGCLDKKDLKCIVSNLSLYPGIRFLILVDRAKVYSKFPAQMFLTIRVVDTGLNYNYKIIDTNKEFKSEKEFKLYLKEISNGILKFAQKKKSIMEWYARIFSIKKDKYYVNSGKLSGIKPGEILKVVEYGEPIFAPTGVPVAWSPGETIGKLKVIRLIGEDVSECSRIEGDRDFKVGNIVIK